MSKIVELLKKSGYSKKAIEYFVKKTNVGEIKDASVFFSFTGPCGDTIEIYLKIKHGIIKQAKFQATGCAGAFASGSALCEIIKGKTLDQAKNIKKQEIIKSLGGLPGLKIHCACLAKTTLNKAIEKYLK
ncbi:hypothetical protein AMJ49_05130 [Parcubacteria bacterium DG_74_2]|nr:MAG: hypothetical protein AMJ49_05130 [Parcubacteria bacterium DG_74_2]